MMGDLLSQSTMLMMAGLFVLILILRIVAKLACLALTVVLVLGLLAILGYGVF